MLLAPFLTIPACENPITFVWNVTVETDAAQYIIPSLITLNIQNDSEKAVKLRKCHNDLYFEIQRQVGIQWQSVYIPECADMNQYRALAPANRYSFTIDSSVLAHLETVDGTYRIEVHIFPDDERNMLLPVHMRTSNTFRIIAN